MTNNTYFDETYGEEIRAMTNKIRAEGRFVQLESSDYPIIFSQPNVIEYAAPDRGFKMPN